ncbi:MAG: Uma2 family endonuclease [Emticicia sp.]|nr:Uma2 family endonuclease [Emticicia sp.]
MLVVEDILQMPNLRKLIDELEAAWADEQKRRHEFWAEIDENIKAEFILGEIIYHSPIYGRHWMASSNLLTYLLPYVKKNKLGKIAVEKVMIRLTRNDYEPDICFWKKERTLDFGKKQSAFPAPDFIVEILSDSTRERDYGIKMTDYALHGVQEYWIIDTDSETVEQYLLEKGTYQLAQKLKEGNLSSEVINGFVMKVNEIFE